MQEMSYLSLIAEATIVVQIVLGMLLLMSMSSWYIIFSKFFGLSSAYKKTGRDLAFFQEAKDLHSAIEIMGRDLRSPSYRVAVEGVNELNRFDDFDTSSHAQYNVIKENLRRALRHGVSSQMEKLSSSLSFLATCANAAPFIGLFGTVWGIMHSFHNIGMMKTASLAVVAPGISEALVATAIGLAVAIPATIAYNYFQGMLGRIEAELINFAGVFLNRVQRELPTLAEG